MRVRQPSYLAGSRGRKPATAVLLGKLCQKDFCSCPGSIAAAQTSSLRRPDRSGRGDRLPKSLRCPDKLEHPTIMKNNEKGNDTKVPNEDSSLTVQGVIYYASYNHYQL